MIRSDEIQEYSKHYLRLLSDIYQCCSSLTTNIRPYLQGEDKHTYGVILEASESLVKLLFFTPDFPLMEEKMEQKEINAIIQWIQTIPLEYVPSVFAYLKSCSIHIPFLCPSLPSRDQISFRKQIRTRIFEK